MKDTGGQAFPVSFSNSNNIREIVCLEGMTLRQYFAIHAPKMTEQWWKDSKYAGDHIIQAEVAWRYAYADAMIAGGQK